MKNDLKKALAVGLTGTTALTLLTGCFGGGSANSDEWKSAYLDYIQNVYAAHPDVNDWEGGLRGTFIYIDGDEIPEMLLELPFTEEVVVSYKNGQVVTYNEPNATVYGSRVESYNEYEGVFLYKGTWETADTDYLVELTDDGFQDLYLGEITKVDQDFNPLDDSDKPCTWNGTEVVGIEAYEEAMSEDYNLAIVTKPDLDYDYEGIKAYLTE